jgi:hypothetical protein
MNPVKLAAIVIVIYQGDGGRHVLSTPQTANHPWIGFSKPATPSEPASRLSRRSVFFKHFGALCTVDGMSAATGQQTSAAI